MDFENKTSLSAAFLTTLLPNDDEMLATAIVKASGIVDDDHITIERALDVPILDKPTETDLGLLPTDHVLGKAGVDVMAMGYAYSADSNGSPCGEVVMALNDDTRRLAVFGDRTWYRDAFGNWNISPPEPFIMMPLTWRNSFGGIALNEDGDEVPYPINMDGTGYVLDGEDLEDEDLPNIENPDHLIEQWTDQPQPCNICPAPRQMKFDLDKYLKKVGMIRETGDILTLPYSFWNDAHPKFRFERVLPGDRLILHGMTYPVPSISFIMPNIDFELNILVASNVTRAKPILDTVLWLPEERRVLFTWRYTFKYPFIARDTRVATLRETTCHQEMRS